MRINLNHYIIGKKFVQEWFLEKSPDDPGYAASLLSVSTHIPLVVVAFFISEADNWSDRTLEIVDRVIKFYDYKQIDGIPEECPKKWDNL